MKRRGRAFSLLWWVEHLEGNAALLLVNEHTHTHKEKNLHPTRLSLVVPLSPVLLPFSPFEK
jgi:hypothetical protein